MYCVQTPNYFPPAIDFFLPASERRILRLPIWGEPRPDGEKGKIRKDTKAIKDAPDGRKIKRNHKLGSNIDTYKQT